MARKKRKQKRNLGEGVSLNWYIGRGRVIYNLEYYNKLDQKVRHAVTCEPKGYILYTLINDSFPFHKKKAKKLVTLIKYLHDLVKTDMKIKHKHYMPWEKD